MNDALAGIGKYPKQAETDGPVHGREGRTTRERGLRSHTRVSKPGKRNNTSKAARSQEAGRFGRSRNHKLLSEIRARSTARDFGVATEGPKTASPVAAFVSGAKAVVPVSLADHATSVTALSAGGTAVLVAAMPLNLGLITAALVGVLGGLGTEGVAERRRR